MIRAILEALAELAVMAIALAPVFIIAWSDRHDRKDR